MAMKKLAGFLTISLLMLAIGCEKLPDPYIQTDPTPTPTPTPTPNPQPEPVPVESISLDHTAISLLVDESLILISTVLPENAADKNVTWVSSDPLVASVSSGRVTGISPGTATIMAKAGDKEASCAVTVVKGGFPDGEVPPSNEIWYTTKDNQPLSQVNNQGACVLTANTYSNGMGVLRFSGPITRLEAVSSEAKQCSRLTGLLIPDSVEQIGPRIFWDAPGIKEFRIPASLMSRDTEKS